MQAAVAKAKMKFKPLVDEEEERRRASAAAKLRALDEAIAKRKAEEDRCANADLLEALGSIWSVYVPSGSNSTTSSKPLPVAEHNTVYALLKRRRAQIKTQHK